MRSVESGVFKWEHCTLKSLSTRTVRIELIGAGKWPGGAVRILEHIRRRLEGVDELFPRSLRASSWADQSRVWDAPRSALVTRGSHELHYVWPTVYS